jgi:hypothetical protein
VSAVLAILVDTVYVSPYFAISFLTESPWFHRNGKLARVSSSFQVSLKKVLHVRLSSGFTATTTTPPTTTTTKQGKRVVHVLQRVRSTC